MNNNNKKMLMPIHQVIRIRNELMWNACGWYGKTTENGLNKFIITSMRANEKKTDWEPWLNLLRPNLMRISRLNNNTYPESVSTTFFFYSIRKNI